MAKYNKPPKKNWEKELAEFDRLQAKSNQEYYRHTLSAGLDLDYYKSKKFGKKKHQTHTR